MFSSLDGVGIKMLALAGITVAWITGSNAPSVAYRAQALGVVHLVQGAMDKLTPWDALRAELRLPPSACAHVGDDLPDLPILVRCGLAVSVPHAPAAVRDRSHYVTLREGGAGAVREVCELILTAQDALAPQLAAFGGLKDSAWIDAAHSLIDSWHGRPYSCWAVWPRSPIGSTRRCRQTPRAVTALPGTTPTCTSRTSAR